MRRLSLRLSLQPHRLTHEMPSMGSFAHSDQTSTMREFQVSAAARLTMTACHRTSLNTSGTILKLAMESENVLRNAIFHAIVFLSRD